MINFLQWIKSVPTNDPAYYYVPFVLGLITWIIWVMTDAVFYDYLPRRWRNHSGVCSAFALVIVAAITAINIFVF